MIDTKAYEKEEFKMKKVFKTLLGKKKLEAFLKIMYFIYTPTSIFQVSILFFYLDDLCFYSLFLI